MTSVVRLNWGCGERPAPGWTNSDIRNLPGVDLCADILRGLPVADRCFDYAVSIHALQMVGYFDLVPALTELRRVLRCGGTLRLSLPDLDRAVAAYQRGDATYFCIPDSDERTISGKLVAQLLWYGSSRTLFTAEFANDLLNRAGFARVMPCTFHSTASGHDDIVALDDRPRESLFVEAVAP